MLSLSGLPWLLATDSRSTFNHTGSPFLDACFPRQVLDLHTVDPEVGGFLGGFAWEGYGYLVPCRSFQVDDDVAFGPDQNGNMAPQCSSVKFIDPITHNLIIEA